MNFVVLPGHQMMNINLEENHAIISINDPDREAWPLRINANCIDYMRLYFHDIDLPEEQKTLFSKAHALEITEFVKVVQYKVDTIVVHCAMGHSRSPAVAAAISYFLDGKGSEQIFFDRHTPNRHVFRELLETLMNS